MRTDPRPSPNAYLIPDQRRRSRTRAAIIDGIGPEPVLALTLKPQPEHFLGTIGADAQGDVDRFIADHAFVSDFYPDRIEKDQRIDRIERALLPDGRLYISVSLSSHILPRCFPRMRICCPGKLLKE